VLIMEAPSPWTDCAAWAELNVPFREKATFTSSPRPDRPRRNLSTQRRRAQPPRPAACERA